MENAVQPVCECEAFRHREENESVHIVVRVTKDRVKPVLIAYVQSNRGKSKCFLTPSAQYDRFLKRLGYSSIPADAYLKEYGDATTLDRLAHAHFTGQKEKD